MLGFHGGSQTTSTDAAETPETPATLASTSGGSEPATGHIGDVSVIRIATLQMARDLELLGDAGFSPLEAIRTATSTPAKMLGLDAEIGTLEVGKRADLILVAGDASEDLGVLRDVRWTIRDGVARTPEGWMKP